MKQAGGAHRGLNLWLLQRASAVYLALFIPYFVVCVLITPAMDYVRWTALFVPTGMKVGVLLGMAALMLHAWIGLREIFIDYLHCSRCLPLRLFLYFAFAVLYLGCLVWTADSLWSVS